MTGGKAVVPQDSNVDDQVRPGLESFLPIGSSSVGAMDCWKASSFTAGDCITPYRVLTSRSCCKLRSLRETSFAAKALELVLTRL